MFQLNVGSNFTINNEYREFEHFIYNYVKITDQFNDSIEISLFTEPGYKVELIHSQDKLGMDGECTHEYTEPHVIKITVPSYVEEEDWF